MMFLPQRHLIEKLALTKKPTLERGGWGGAPAGAAPKGHLNFLSARDKAEVAIGYQEMDGHGAYCVRHNGVGFYMEYTSNSRQTIRCASPQHTQTVWLRLSEVGVFREQRQMLTDGLPDQHAVERVFVLASW